MNEVKLRFQKTFPDFNISSNFFLELVKFLDSLEGLVLVDERMLDWIDRQQSKLKVLVSCEPEIHCISCEDCQMEIQNAKSSLEELEAILDHEK